MPLNDCDELLNTMQIRAQIPVASGSWSAAEILKAASEEALTHMLPKLVAARGEYLVRSTDISTVAGTSLYRLPYRAAALREVKLLQADGVERPITVIEPEKETQLLGDPTVRGEPQYAIFEDGSVRLRPVPQATGQTIRVKWHIRPNRMTAVSNATRISAIAAGASTTVFTVGSIPAAMNAVTEIDLVRGQNRFEILGFDLATSALSTGGVSITLANGIIPSGPDYPVVGDYFAAANYSPFPNFPVECHIAVALRGAAAVVRSKGDKTLAEDLEGQAARQEGLLLSGLLTPRSQGNTRKLVNRRFF